MIIFLFIWCGLADVPVHRWVFVDAETKIVSHAAGPFCWNECVKTRPKGEQSICATTKEIAKWGYVVKP
jgi:hypothetical protein